MQRHILSWRRSITDGCVAAEAAAGDACGVAADRCVAGVLAEVPEATEAAADLTEPVGATGGSSDRSVPGVLEEEDAGEGDAGPMRRFTVRLNPKELGQYATL